MQRFQNGDINLVLFGLVVCYGFGLFVSFIFGLVVFSFLLHFSVSNNLFPLISSFQESVVFFIASLTSFCFIMSANSCATSDVF